MSSRIRQNLTALFQNERLKISEEEIEKLKEFLSRGFCYIGEAAIGTIFLMAVRRQKSLNDVLQECEKEWERNWKYQDPDIRGDPEIGSENKASLENIYQALGFFLPSEEMQKKIPKQAFVVVTENSTYRFGKTNEIGERTVSRDERPLGFQRCIILYLVVDKGMQIRPIGGSRGIYFTSIVREIKPESE